VAKDSRIVRQTTTRLAARLKPQHGPGDQNSGHSFALCQCSHTESEVWLCLGRNLRLVWRGAVMTTAPIEEPDDGLRTLGG